MTSRLPAHCAKLALLLVMVVFSEGAALCEEWDEDVCSPNPFGTLPTPEEIDQVGKANDELFGRLSEAANDAWAAGVDVVNDWNNYQANFPKTYDTQKNHLYAQVGAAVTGGAIVGKTSSQFGSMLTKLGEGKGALGRVGSALGGGPGGAVTWAVGGAMALTWLNATFPDRYHESFTADLVERHDIDQERAEEIGDAVADAWSRHSAQNAAFFSGNGMERWLNVVRAVSFDCAKQRRHMLNPRTNRFRPPQNPVICAIWGAIPGNEAPASGPGKRGGGSSGNSIYAPSNTDCVENCDLKCDINSSTPFLDVCACVCRGPDESINVRDVFRNPLDPTEECKVLSDGTILK